MKLPVKTVEKTDHTEAGNIVRARRKKRKMSLRTLATKMGISAPYLSDLERGHRPWTVEKFGQALKLIGI